MQNLTTKELSENLALGESTIRTWMKQFEIPHEKKRGKIVFKEDAQEIFETIKDLKSKDCGMDTIRRRIGVSFPDSLEQNENKRHDSDMTESLQDLIEETLEQQKKEFTLIIRDNNELAEKYAKATYTIGQLEAEKRMLQEQNHEIKQQISLLPAPYLLTEALNKATTAEEKNTQLEKQLSQLQEQQLSLMQQNTILQEHLKLLDTPKAPIPEEISPPPLPPEVGLWEKLKQWISG